LSPWRLSWRDLAWLLLLAAVVLGAGLGWRDPWPADEPRFALIARDMAQGASWWVPHIGGDLYQDKPPLFFWAIAVGYLVTGSLQVAFLLPSFFAGLLAIALVWDLAYRLWSRTIAVHAALLLLATVQFLLQARAAQIDGFLLAFTVLSLYGLARHLLLGPAWGWYAVAGLSAGLGVATKGVGFLPLLLFLPWWGLRRAGFVFPVAVGSWRWTWAPLGLLLGIAVWLVPMLFVVAQSQDPAYAAYRDEILFQQTVQRYANAWHHQAPPWFFLVNVIPGLWLPGTLLLPWVVGLRQRLGRGYVHSTWLGQWQHRDPRALLFLGWVLVVVLFFSLSTGKRGVYVLQAVPAFVLSLAPLMPRLLARRGVQWLFAGLLGAVAVALAGAVAWFATVGAPLWHRLGQDNGLEAPAELLAPLATIAAVAALALAVGRLRRAPVAMAVTLWGALVVQGFWINPLLDASRSGAAFMQQVEAAVPAGTTLGLVNYREQFLLQASRPVVNFGHRRWREGQQEVYEASAWLSAGSASAPRVLLVEGALLAECFGAAQRRWVARASRQSWYLVMGPAAPACVARGAKGRTAP
jgi:4-amino-4-deoxy-L-arabinose transferase-like glycosyltransferase